MLFLIRRLQASAISCLSFSVWEYSRGFPALLDADINRAAQETRYELDMTEIERQFWTPWESTGKQDFKKGAAQAFMGFTRKNMGR